MAPDPAAAAGPARARRAVVPPALVLALALPILLRLAACGSAPPARDDAVPPVPTDAARAAPALRFDSEVVRIAVLGDTLRVEGLYRFAVPGPSLPRTPILYPYPREIRLGRAWTEYVECRTADGPWRPVPWRELRDGIGARWLLAADDDRAFEVRTEYRQLLREEYGRYIVTTTAGWGEPLRRARFEITLPPGARPLSFSHSFVEEKIDGRRVFVLDVDDFLPDRDIVFTWETGRRAELR